MSEIQVVEIIRKYVRKPKGRITGIRLLDELTAELSSSPAYDRQVRMALMEFDLFVTPGTPAHKNFLETTDEGVEPTVQPEHLGVKEWVESMKSPKNLFGRRFRAEIAELSAELMDIRNSSASGRGAWVSQKDLWEIVKKISRAITQQSC